MIDRIFSIFKKYLKKYVSTRTVFLMDVLISIVASFISALFAESLVGGGVFLFWGAVSWAVVSGAASALLVWIFRTYRIIIRHTPLRQLARFACVAAGESVVKYVICTHFFILY